MSTFGTELIESAGEALAIARGEIAPARMISPHPVDVAAALAAGKDRDADTIGEPAGGRPPTLRGRGGGSWRCACGPRGTADRSGHP